MSLRLCLCLLVALGCVPAWAQEVFLDRSLNAAGVTLYAARSDPHGWYYLPDTPQIAENEQGLPELSLVKYTAPAEPAGGGSSGITAARGGGVLHLLATFRVTPERLRRADEALRSVPERKDDRILGPIQYRSGTFALVSSVLAPGGGMARRLVGVGPAPLLEGGKVAVSAELTPEGATFLWKSFEMANPDVSLAFSLQFEGYRTPYEAELVANWDRLFARQDVQARLKVLWFGVDVKSLIDESFTNGTMRVDVKGESAEMQPLLDAAYAKLASLLFDPMPLASAPQADTDSLGGVLGALKQKIPVDLFAGYQVTKQHLAGTAHIRLAQQRAEPSFVLLTGNVGPLGRRWGSDTRIFRTINLEDPAFRQREVTVSFDGEAEDFARAVDHLVVQVEKRHADGTVTLREALLDPKALAASGNRLTFAYPNAGDADLQQWLRYRYRAVWAFRGGKQHDAGWQEADAFALSLRPPYAVRRVSFEGEPQALQAAQVRSVVAKVTWDFLGETKTETVTLRAGVWNRELALVLPADRPTFSVTLTWHLAGGRTTQRGPTEQDGEVVYIDELPTDAKPATAPVQGGSR